MAMNFEWRLDGQTWCYGVLGWEVPLHVLEQLYPEPEFDIPLDLLEKKDFARVSIGQAHGPRMNAVAACAGVDICQFREGVLWSHPRTAAVQGVGGSCTLAAQSYRQCWQNGGAQLKHPRRQAQLEMPQVQWKMKRVNTTGRTSTATRGSLPDVNLHQFIKSSALIGPGADNALKYNERGML